jgi:hypothetical protein
LNFNNLKGKILVKILTKRCGLGTIHQSNFNSKEFIFLSAAAGLVYYAVATKYQLLSEAALKVQMGAYALATVIGSQILGSQRVEKQYFCTATPIFIIGAATFFTKATWKTKVIGTAILSASLLMLGRMCTEMTVMNGSRGKPIREDLSLGDISLVEMHSDPYKIRGFDKMVQQPWLEKQLEALCLGKAHFVPVGITDEDQELLDLDELLTENQEPIPTVMLINNKRHYSIVVYDPRDKKVYCFNSLSTVGNPLEQKVIQKMEALFEVEEVVRNKAAHQLKADGWSCAFRVMRFLEHFLDGASMEDFDRAPIPEQVLARKLSVYYHFLAEEFVKPPVGFEMFFNITLDDRTVIQLRNLLQTACRKGWEKKEEEASFLTNQQQIECILIKLWLMEQKQPGVFREFVNEMGKGQAIFSSNQRNFLSQALTRMEWTREAIVNLFTSTYFKETGEPISPD